jgi:hypothetical protein
MHSPQFFYGQEAQLTGLLASNQVKALRVSLRALATLTRGRTVKQRQVKT